MRETSTLWEDDLGPDRPLRRTHLFWSCLPMFLYAVLATAGLIVRIFQHSSNDFWLLFGMAFVFLDIAILYRGQQFFRNLREFRALVGSITDAELRSKVVFFGQQNAKLFVLAMGGIGMVAFAASMLFFFLKA